MFQNYTVQFLYEFVDCRSALLCPFHITDTDETRLSCLVRVGGLNLIGDKSRQFSVYVVLNIFETEELQIGKWVETGQNYLVLSSVQFTPPTRTRQDSFVLSVSAV